MNVDLGESSISLKPEPLDWYSHGHNESSQINLVTECDPVEKFKESPAAVKKDILVEKEPRLSGFALLKQI